jgi:hypothetical protein
MTNGKPLLSSCAAWRRLAPARTSAEVLIGEQHIAVDFDALRGCGGLTLV